MFHLHLSSLIFLKGNGVIHTVQTFFSTLMGFEKVTTGCLEGKQDVKIVTRVRSLGNMHMWEKEI